MKFRIPAVVASIAVLALFAAGQTPSTKPFANPANLKEKAPDTFKAKFETSKGDFVIEVHRAWVPNGADRFYNLVQSGFFDDVRFYRVVSGFMAQFGINGDPVVDTAWSRVQLPDDTVKESNKRGYVTFAQKGIPNSRGTQLFINFGDNVNLDKSGFAPIGRVVTGMNIVDKLYNGYGDIKEQRGGGPSQTQFNNEGNAYLIKSFSKLDYIKKATIAE